jgi:hypothetical protein
MSMSRRKFILASAAGCTVPSTVAIFLNVLGEPILKLPKFTTIKELSERLDGRPDFYYFRLAGPQAFAHHRRKYEETFGHPVPRGFRPPNGNLIQMLRLAWQDNLPIREFMDGTIKSLEIRSNHHSYLLE